MQIDLNEINNIAGTVDSLYHEAALKIGLSDREMDMLYVISIYGNGCQQSFLYKETGLKKSTVNTSLHRLMKEGVLYLEDGDGRNKKVFLTENGMEYLKRVEKLMNIEREIYESWTDEERDLYMDLSRRFVKQLEAKMQEL
ncbi:MAG: MarR family transcriptional regulator [Lachnospiraceae bacterium]|nr:MarR family transcriptional regulator [Lachnospiraceae bacterium]